MLTYIDLHFGRFINRLAGSNDPDIFLAAALVSNAAGNGDVCLDLESFARKVISEEGEESKPVINARPLMSGLKNWAGPRLWADRVITGPWYSTGKTDCIFTGTGIMKRGFPIR